MVTFNCVIVDDSEIDQLSLKAFLSKFPEFTVIGVFSSPVKALEVVKNIAVDVLFLDIQMPELNGLEFRKKVSAVPACVFISYSPDYAVESFELEVLDYVLKPLKFDRFEKTIAKIKNHLLLKRTVENMEPAAQFVYLKNGTEKVKVDLSEVVFLEASNDYTNMHMAKGTKLLSYTLGKALQTEPFHNFIRIHRSFAVSKDNIYKVFSNKVILQNGTKLPVGRGYKQTLHDLL